MYTPPPSRNVELAAFLLIHSGLLKINMENIEPERAGRKEGDRFNTDL